MNKTKLIINVYYYTCKYNDHDFISLTPCNYCIECNKPASYKKTVQYEIDLENNIVRIIGE